MKIEANENMFGVLILFTVFSPSIVHSNYFNTNNEKNDQCFCKVLFLLFSRYSNFFIKNIHNLQEYDICHY